MADVYYKIDGTNCYYTNEPKDGYSTNGIGYIAVASGKNIIIELYNDKFVFPERAHCLFEGCTNLEFNDIDKWDTSQCTNMSRLFWNCKFKTIDLSHFDTSKVTIFSGMFYKCSNLLYLDCSSFDTSKGDWLDSMFEYCTSLVWIDVSSFKMTSATHLSSMFAECPNLTKILAKENTDWKKEVASTNWSTDMFTNDTRLPNWSSSTGSVDLNGCNNTTEIGYFGDMTPAPRLHNVYFYESGWTKCDVLVKNDANWEEVEVLI